MRIERLGLDFFGHFTGKIFDFGKGGRASDFHVIYGPNEAGKTTTMEGYLRLLYGFPHREPFAFQHQRPNLRVSALLDVGEESRLFTRLPSRSGNLRGENEAILPETALAAHLGGLSIDDYRSLLCLNDETIEQGGEDIANARGDIGRLLFSAAAGVADLNALLDQTRADAGKLYRKRASTTQVAELKRELDEVDRKIREKDVNAGAWRKLKDALRSAEDDEASARAARDGLRVLLASTAAQQRALPALGELERLHAELADHADFPDSLVVDAETLVSMQTERLQNEADTRRLIKEIGEAEGERADLCPSDERLALAAKLDDLDDLRSRMQTAALDLPRRQRAFEEACMDMQRTARELGAPDGCDVSALVKSPDDIALLESLRDAMREAAQAQEAEAREVERLQDELDEAQHRHQTLLDNALPQAGLLALLVRFDSDTLVLAAAAARQAIRSAEDAFQDALEAMTIGGRAFSALPECPVDPSTATDLAERDAVLAAEMAGLADVLVRLDEDVAVTAAKIATIATGTGVAGDGEARSARDHRDALWRSHREALNPETAEAFAQAMERVDRIDAERLAHARELGALRQLELALAEAETRQAKAKEHHDRLTAEKKEIETRAEAIAATVGLQGLSPAGLSDWVERHGMASAARREREKLAGHHRATLDKAARLHEALEPLVPLDNPHFDAAISAARRLAEEEREYEQKRRSAADTETDLKRQLERRDRRLAVLAEAAQAAAGNWAAKVRDLFGGLVPDDRLITGLSQLHTLREHDARRQQAARQVSSMEDDQRQFTEAVSRLIARFGIAGGDPLDAFRLLREIAAQAQTDHARHRALSKKIEEDTARLEVLNARLETLDREVAALGAGFPETVDTSTLDALRVALGRGREIIAKRTRAAELEGRILDYLSLRDINEARATLSDATAAALEAKAKSLETDLDSAEKRLSAATVTRANAERDLGAITGSAEIAELTERRATLQMQIEATLIDYLERDFGLRLAEEAIRRYRDRHRSGMLEASERAFSALTAGAYRRLLTQPDGPSERLVAVDASGTSKQIDEMSKGTRFQLYLALRAAAYEQMVSQGVQLPFFCDDIFETFDEDRTRAACRLMEQIGRSGQAIYLTHHRHVVEIAGQVCEAQPVLHEI